MSDAVTALQQGFDERLAVLIERHKDAISTVSLDDASEFGGRAADAALAPVLWAAALGERWSTTTVTEFLNITRQALHKRVVNGTVLGVPGRGTTWFPVWQFDLEAHRVRPVVAEIVATFRDELGAVDPLVIASWATSDQPEFGMSPEAWLAAGKDPVELGRIARRTAAELGR